MSSAPRPSRRAIVGAAVWSAPVVVVAAAVPAVAASTPSLTASPGGAYADPIGGGLFLSLESASVTATGTSVPAGTLTMTIVVPTDGRPHAPRPIGSMVFGWTLVGSDASSSVFQLSAGLADGETYVFPEAYWDGVDGGSQPGSFLCTFSAPDLASSSFTVTGPSSGRGAATGARSSDPYR